MNLRAAVSVVGRKRDLAVSIAVQPAVLALFLPFDVPSIPDIGQMFEDGVRWILRNVTKALLSAMGKIFTVQFETFLFFENPANVEILNRLWMTSLGVFAGVAGLAFLYLLLMAMLFPGTDKADLQVFLERAAKYFVVVFVSRELFAFFVAFVHKLSAFYYRAGFDLTIGVDIGLRIIDQTGSIWTAAVMANVVTLTLVIAGLGFNLILLARMFVIYLTYALFPLFMAFQLVRIGPWKIVNDMGKKFVNASAKLLLLGILVTALLWTSVAVADFSEYSDGENRATFASDAPAADVAPDATFQAGWLDLFQTFVWFATPLLMINFLGFKMLMEIL